MLGKGAQAEVYQVSLKKDFPNQKFVDKTKKVKNNNKIHADRELKNMFAEFCIAKDLEHPNIAKYKYFMRNFDPETKAWDFHIILELVEGPNMNSYIKNNTPDIEAIRNIGF